MAEEVGALQVCRAEGAGRRPARGSPAGRAWHLRSAPPATTGTVTVRPSGCPHQAPQGLHYPPGPLLVAVALIDQVDLMLALEDHRL